MTLPPYTRYFVSPKSKLRIPAAEGILLLVGMLLASVYPGVALDSFVANRTALAHFVAEGESIGATLNRGFGRIPATARPDPIGNIGIAGHRDVFFPGLREMALGDTIDPESPEANRTHLVGQSKVVKPDDPSVLKPTSTPSLMLVTCYPFFSVGDALMRCIVSVSLDEEVPENNDLGLAKTSEAQERGTKT